MQRTHRFLYCVGAAAVFSVVCSAPATAQPAHLSRLLPLEHVRAHGTWHTGDGAAYGTWRARFRIGRLGNMTGMMTIEAQRGSAPPPARRARLVGRVTSDRIEFGAVLGVRRPDRRNFPKQRLATFEAAVGGVKIDGTFTLPDGRSGYWDGWWTVPAKKIRAERRAKPRGQHR